MVAALWHEPAVAMIGAVVLVLSLFFCTWMLRVFRRRDFVTRYS